MQISSVTFLLALSGAVFGVVSGYIRAPKYEFLTATEELSTTLGSVENVTEEVKVRHLGWYHHHSYQPWKLYIVEAIALGVILTAVVKITQAIIECVQEREEPTPVDDQTGRAGSTPTKALGDIPVGTTVVVIRTNDGEDATQVA